MKFVKIAVLAATAAGSLLAASCCSGSNPAPAPSQPSYVAPSK